MFFFLGQNLSPRQTTGRRPQQSSASRQTTSNGVPRAEPLKFEGEFDFEQANARFEQEIEKEFTDKLKISSDKQRSNKRNQSKDKQQQQQQHDLDSSLTNSQSMTLQDMQDQQHMLMKQKSLSTTNTDHDLSKDHQHHARDTHTMSAEEKNFYDKNISFFDRISCEANDKLQSKERKNWKEERKMNAETFGLIQRQQNDMMKSNYSRTASPMMILENLAGFWWVIISFHEGTNWRTSRISFFFKENRYRPLGGRLTSTCCYSV